MPEHERLVRARRATHSVADVHRALTAADGTVSYRVEQGDPGAPATTSTTSRVLAAFLQATLRGLVPSPSR